MEFVSKVLPFYIFFLACLLLKIHGESISFKRSTYIVHMQKSAMPKAFLNHHFWYSSIIDSLKFVSPVSTDQHQSSPSVLYIYDHALHGFSASLSLVELRALKNHLGFILVYKDQTGKLSTTRTPEFLSLNPEFGLWPTSNYGEGIVIGIVDSGIWPESASFRDHNMTPRTRSKWNGSCDGGKTFNSSLCSLKIIGVRYFDEGLKQKHGVLASTESARDTVGHGTTIASIAAGNYVEDVSYFGLAKGTAKGVAPLAKLSIYKVGWDNDKIVGSDVLAGIDQAISDGVDVISIACATVEPSIATASFSAMEKGIVVTVATGNAGAGFANLMNDIPWVITVTASTIDRWFSGILTLGNGETITGWSMFHEKESVPQLPLVYDEFQRVCNSELLATASHGIIVCHGDDIPNQVKLVAFSRLSGAIFFYKEPMLLESQIEDCPCVVIGASDAKKLLEYVKHASNPTASITFKQTIVDVKHAPLVASYSPKGPSKFFPRVLKPDVMAPGSTVLASSIPKQGSINNNYEIVSGTSFACPHVAGVTALLRALYPKWSPAAIRSAIMTTASELDNNKNHIRDYYRDPNNSANYPDATPLGIGAGHINPKLALDPGLIYDATPQDYVNLMCTVNTSKDYIQAITRSDLYDCSQSKSSFDLNYPSFIAYYTHNPEKIWTKNFTRTVTNVGEGAASYKVKIKKLESFKVTVWPNTLVFGRKYERQSYTLMLANQGNMKHETSFGHILWEEQTKIVKSRHKVRSPIVVIHGIVPKPKNLLDPNMS